MYAMGLFGDGERKSIEPIAARSCADPGKTDALHQRLLHFATDAKWSDRGVRRLSAQHVISAMTALEPIEEWIIDDTGFLKQGTHSVGVQRQYTGSAGKVTNCQIGVSLSVATATDHAPIDFELYLPKAWTDDAARRAEARIPDEVQFKTKPELALDMIRRAVADGVPPGVVLADSAYGSARKFREGVRALGLHYGVGVDPKTTVHLLDDDERPQGDRISVQKLALEIEKRKGFRRCTWRDGSRKKLSANFAVRRVIPAHAGGPALELREPLWLVTEWRDGESAPANHFLVSLPNSLPRLHIIRILMQRWRTERIYEDLKGQLGLDHFEGRRFTGWHHHVSVALCCYAFISAERMRSFFSLEKKARSPRPAARNGPSDISRIVSSLRTLRLPAP
jgi:SRSO17 transposase